MKLLPNSGRGLPFLPMKSDPYFRSARRWAALSLTTVNSIWVFGSLWQMTVMESVGTANYLIFMMGFFYLVSKSSLVSDVALAIKDRREGIPFTPPKAEIWQRSLIGFIIPAFLMALIVAMLPNTNAVAILTAAVLILEVSYYLLGYNRWKKTNIPTPILRAILFGKLGEAITAYRTSDAFAADQEEITVLALATLAFREKKAPSLQELEQIIEDRSGLNAEPAVAARTGAMLRADYERLMDPAASGPSEAAALSLLPVGHPRRLTLALYVATAALEAGDGESALKSLELLHTRELPSNPSRAVANWLAFRSVEVLNNEEERLAFLALLRRFNLIKISTIMSAPAVTGDGDPYAKWLSLAQDEMKKLARVAPKVSTSA